MKSELLYISEKVLLPVCFVLIKFTNILIGAGYGYFAFQQNPGLRTIDYVNALDVLSPFLEDVDRMLNF